MTVGSWSKNTAGSTQGGCLVEYLGRLFSSWHGENGELAPIFGFHLPVELAERVELDLAQRGLYGSVILVSVIHEDARHGHGEVGGRASPRRECLPGSRLSSSAQQPCRTRAWCRTADQAR